MGAPRSILAVLAGGHGRRLGGAKASVVLAGHPLIYYPLWAARTAGLDTVVVAKPATSLPAGSGRVVYDSEQVHHPLSGLLAALEFLDRECSGVTSAVVVACDMPFLEPLLLRWLAELQEPCVVGLEGAPQPLLGRYGTAQIPILRRALGEERSLRETVAELAPRMIDVQKLTAFGSPSRLCFNVNDSADLRQAEEWLR